MIGNPQRVVALKTENFKRLHAVEITPEENTVVLTGKNAQGKSSVLDSIWWALGGGAAGKKITNPIRNGATKAVAEVTLDDFVVTRSASVDKKTSTLTVTKRDGTRVTSPQKVLDEMIGKLTFDPLEFTRLAAKEQREYLLNAVDIGIDLDAHDEERAEAFAERTFVNRQVKELEARMSGFELPEKMPEPVDTAALMAELQSAQTVQRQKDAVTQQISNSESRIFQLEEELSRERKNLEELKSNFLFIADQKCRDEEIIQSEIASAAVVNSMANKFHEASQVKADFDAKKHDADELTAKIKSMDIIKADLLAGAEMPIEGLGIEGDTVTFQGQPLAQASSAEQTKVALAIAVALNPNLRIAYIRDGSLLDSDSLEIVRAIAEQCDFQVFIELVDETGEAGIVIEDGKVADQLW